MKSFNSTPPTPGRREMWRTIEVGWSYTTDGDDIIISADENGNPIPRTYRVPATLTSGQLLDALRTVGADRLESLAQEGGLDAAVELLGAIVGDDTLLTIAKDPTVEPDTFTNVLLDLIESLNLADAIPGGGPGNPPVPPAAAA